MKNKNKKKTSKKKETPPAEESGLYFRIIEDYFVNKIQRLASVPASPPFLFLSEIGLIHDWHKKEIPLDIVLNAIDKAFKDPVKAPKSLQDCKDLVDAEFQRWQKTN
jgi:hypothetical protein